MTDIITPPRKVKNIICHTFTFVSAILLIACSKQECPTTSSPDTPDNLITISFKEAASKTTINDNGLGTLKYTWVEGDKLYVYDGAQYLGTVSLYTGEEGKETGFFHGKITTPSTDSIIFYHFGPAVTPPTSAFTEVDVFNQEGTLDWINDHVVARCAQEYHGEGQYSGFFHLAFAIGKFKFAPGSYSTGATVTAYGQNQKVRVSPDGNIEYVAPTTPQFSEVTYDDARSFYIAMPSHGVYDYLAFSNEATEQGKMLSKVNNGMFYRNIAGDDIQIGLNDINCTVTYLCDDGRGLSTFHQETVTTTRHSIIPNEPYWQGTGSTRYTFDGWSENPDDAQGHYFSATRELGMDELVTAGRNYANLYAIWKEIDTPGPYVDFENYICSDVLRFDYLHGWSFNDYIKYSSFTGVGYEKINFPIYNLEENQYYALYFGENLTNVGGGNMFHSLGIYACAVRSSAATSVSYNSMLTYTTSSDAANPFVWIHSLGSYNTKNYTPTSDNRIIFKATSNKMWWIFDLSKEQNHNEIINHVYLNAPKIEPFNKPTGPNVDFMETKFYGCKTSDTGSNADAKAKDSAGHMAGQGYSTYIQDAEDNNYIRMSLICSIGKCEKVNIPIINLTPNTTYRLSFSYERESEITNILNSSYDFCYAVLGNAVTNTNEVNYHGKTNWSDNKTSASFSDTITFTTGSDQTSMYWVWSVSNLKNCYWNVHTIRITDFEIVPNPEVNTQINSITPIPGQW